MITENDLLEPSKTYRLSLKDDHHQNVTEYFESLVKEAGVNKDENKATVNAYKAKMAKVNDAEKELKKLKRHKGWTIFFAILLFVTIIAPIFLLGKRLKKLKAQIQDIDNKLEKLRNESNEIKNKAYQQLAPLNALFEWNIPATLISKTTPLIQMDKNFDPAKYQYMHEKYGFDENTDKDVSTVYVQSGSILGNPFLIQRNYVTCMYQHDYVGTLVIHWTTTVQTSNGTQTVNHTQTLTAHIYKPAPKYYLDTWLIYGNGAAPDLCFSRNPSPANGMDEKHIDKYVKDWDKKLDKIVRDAVKKGGSFQRLQNTEFEALFNALDRNNEAQFRLLFTPLAQKSMCDLIKNKDPYGDDFTFIKKKCLNYIKSAHSQGINLDGNPANFYHFDLEVMENNFISECDEYMKSMFFDLAPLLSIPLYQQHKDINYIYKKNYRGNVTGYETEVLANAYNEKLFLHPDSKTHGIIKPEFICKQGDNDINAVHCYSYDTIEHLDFVPVLGGDGNMHNVPVTWIEYIPIEQVTPFTVSNVNTDVKGYRDWTDTDSYKQFVERFANNSSIRYQRGLMSFIPTNELKGFKGDELNGIFKK